MGKQTPQASVLRLHFHYRWSTTAWDIVNRRFKKESVSFAWWNLTPPAPSCLGWELSPCPAYTGCYLGHQTEWSQCLCSSVNANDGIGKHKKGRLATEIDPGTTTNPSWTWKTERFITYTEKKKELCATIVARIYRKTQSLARVQREWCPCSPDVNGSQQDYRKVWDP